jgi:hypothetical protein
MLPGLSALARRAIRPAGSALPLPLEVGNPLCKPYLDDEENYRHSIEETGLMKMQQVSDNCFAVLIEKNRVCDANSGLINLGEGIVIDKQSGLAYARQMIEMFSKV